MSIYMDRIPYTYLIGWSNHNIWYYGVRFAKNCNPSDLFVKYFTSSKHVKAFIKNNGLPDVIQVRKTFNTIDSARKHEFKVLNRIRAAQKSYFLNKTNNASAPLEYSTHFGKDNGMYGKTHTIEAKAKMSRLNKPHSIETKKRMSEARSNGNNYNSKRWKILLPSGEIINIFHLPGFCKEHNIPYNSLMTSFNNNKPITRGPHKGYKLIEVS